MSRHAVSDVLAGLSQVSEVDGDAERDPGGHGLVMIFSIAQAFFRLGPDVPQVVRLDLAFFYWNGKRQF
eukprot:117470-Rhodomonas_salina.1